MFHRICIFTGTFDEEKVPSLETVVVKVITSGCLRCVYYHQQYNSYCSS